jgi:hypothetical protein
MKEARYINGTYTTTIRDPEGAPDTRQYRETRELPPLQQLRRASIAFLGLNKAGTKIKASTVSKKVNRTFAATAMPQ